MARLHTSERGAGFPVILLHGFPFNSALWDDFAKLLNPQYRIIAPDLPGFGQSDSAGSGFEIKDIAKTILDKLAESEVKQSVIVGHSLGGYIALSMVDQHPGMFSGMALFHSTALPDTPEKKENRDKLIDFVKRNGVEAFTGKFIAPLFTNSDHPAITKVREMALKATAETVVNYLTAMKIRPDTTSVLQQFPKDILMITGENDPGISVESVVQQASLGGQIRHEVLAGVAHMGMFEAPEKTAALINDFVRKVTDGKKK
jgi:pimeloyl-ACP methyl ester carboxylesterase